MTVAGARQGPLALRDYCTEPFSRRPDWTAGTCLGFDSHFKRPGVQTSRNEISASHAKKRRPAILFRSRRSQKPRESNQEVSRQQTRTPRGRQFSKIPCEGTAGGEFGRSLAPCSPPGHGLPKKGAPGSWTHGGHMNDVGNSQTTTLAGRQLPAPRPSIRPAGFRGRARIFPLAANPFRGPLCRSRPISRAQSLGEVCPLPAAFFRLAWRPVFQGRRFLRASRPVKRFPTNSLKTAPGRKPLEKLSMARAFGGRRGEARSLHLPSRLSHCFPLGV